MKNRGKKTLRNMLMTAGLASALSFLPVDKTNGQEIVINPYLPANENGDALLGVKTKAQRDSLAQDFLDKDWNDVYHVPPKDNPEIPESEQFDCTQYTYQGLTNNWDWGEDVNLYGGYRGEPVPDSLYKYKGTLKDMGKGGLPFLSIYITSPGKQDHEQLTMITGDNLREWSSYNFIEPQFDAINVQPGEYFMPKDGEVVINYVYTKENNTQGKYLSYAPLVKFQLTNGNPELIWENDDPYVKLFKERDSEKPEIVRESPYENQIFDKKAVPLDYEINDDNFKSAKYSLDGGESWNYLGQSGVKNLNLENGNYKVLIEAEDYFRNVSKDSVNFSVDVIDGLEKKILNEELEFYPNPVSDNLNIKYQSDKYGSLKTEIYSIDGKLVDYDSHEIYSGENLIDVDMSDKVSGVYILNITSPEGNTRTEKIVKR